MVKLTATADGSALSLSDDGQGGVKAYARSGRSVVEVKERDGRVQVLKP